MNPGAKRKAFALEDDTFKKVRCVDNASSSNPTSDSSSNEESSLCDPIDGHQLDSSIATPLTPGSPKASPRYPSDLKSHHCPYSDCDKSFNRPAKLTQHLRSHTNTRPFVCPHAPCIKNFLRESHLKHHIKSAHSNVRDHVCGWNGCGKSFITATRLRRHEATHQGMEKFKCDVLGCSQTFRKHSTLQRHVATVHEGRDPFVCGAVNEEGQACGAGFDTEGKLKSHIGRVHGTRRFECTLCPLNNWTDPLANPQEQYKTMFPTHAALQAHLVSKHPPTCIECGLQCASQSALKNHVEVIHGDFDINERKIYVCPESECGRAFTKKGNLNAHIQINHNGKRFVCGKADPRTLKKVGDWDGSDACGEALTSKANLEKHIRGVHLGLDSSNKVKKRNKKRPAQRANYVSTLTKLTGAGYETDNGRIIRCPGRDCDYRFMREHDLEMHLQSQHASADLTIQAMFAEHDFSQPSDQRRDPMTTGTHTMITPDQHSVEHGNELETKKIFEELCKGEILDNASFCPGVYTTSEATSQDAFADEGREVNNSRYGYHKDDGFGMFYDKNVEMIDPNIL